MQKDVLHGLVKLPAYGDKYYLLDQNNLIMSEAEAIDVVTDSIISVLNTHQSHDLHYKVSSHVNAKRAFSIGASYYEDGGKDYLYPLFNYEAIKGLKSELTMAVHNNHGSVRSGGEVTLYPLKKSLMITGEDEVDCMKRHVVSNHIDALSMARAGGFLAKAAVVFVYPQHIENAVEGEEIVRGKEHCWRIVKTLEFDSHQANGVSRANRLDAIRWFAPIENLTFLNAQNSSGIYLGRNTELHTFLDSIGLRNEHIQAEILAEAEHDRLSNLPPHHEDRVKAIVPLLITLSEHMGKIRDGIVTSSKLRGIICKAKGYDNQQAEDELRKAFEEGFGGVLVQVCVAHHSV